MKAWIFRKFGCVVLVGVLGINLGKAADQFIVLNLSNDKFAEPFTEISREFGRLKTNGVRVGVGAIFSYLDKPRTNVTASLREFLRWARETDTPIVVQLDGEQWWEARPDLWNWWDTSHPGYSPDNRANVEWTNWTAEAAIKISWRNWGQQYRMRPPPNLMSPRYRKACHEEMRVLIPLVLDWWRDLPANQKDLLIGLKVGWESSIGLNSWYYPGGNELATQPAGKDPTTGLKVDEIPARGVVQIGYAAVKTAGIRSEGNVTEADLAEAVRRHLEDLCRVAAELGVPRERLFTHTAGWKDEEKLYDTAVNAWSCPGWSFYRYAPDPKTDAGVQRALKVSDAPYWGAVEWLYQASDQAGWRKALGNTLADPKCRYVCIYNWSGIRGQEGALKAIREMLLSSASKP